MSDFSPMDDGLEYRADSSENDEMEYQPNPSEEDGSDTQPISSSDGDESDDEPRRPHKSNNSIKSVALSQCHLRADTDLKSGTVINIGQTLELHDGSSFLTVTELRRFKNGGLMFFGYLFRRVEEFQDYLLVTSGGTELVWLCEATEHDPKPGGYLRSARSQDVLRIRHLVPTNSDSVSESFPQLGAVGTTTNTKPLFFQWRLVVELSKPNITRGPRNFSSAMKGTQGQPKAFVALSSQEPLLGGITTIAFCNSHHHLDSDLPKPSSDDGSSQPKMHARAIGRNPVTEKEHCRNVLAPTTNGNRTSIGKRSPAIHKPSDHLAESLDHMLKISPPRRRVSEQGIEPRIYTFADGFCGAGGMSKGAENAGLLIVWAFDQDADAIKTYSLNHGKDSCKQMSAESFLESGNAYGTSEVDVLHVSPPCQGFTLACRGLPRNGKKDNKCMTYVGKIVKKVNPRIVTFEQVREVLSKDQGYFKSMVLDLTSIGYSISWRILECADFGVPQRRRRLFVIASRRGEVLPDFPKPTHSHHAYYDESRLQPWQSFAGAIDDLEDSAPNHVIDHPRKERRVERWAPPHPPDWPCHDTVTTGENWPDHYNGKYVCTPREAACLQGFPTDYVFCGDLPATKRQVVNAVPPPMGKAILEKVKRSLMATDASRSP